MGSLLAGVSFLSLCTVSSAQQSESDAAFGWLVGARTASDAASEYRQFNHRGVIFFQIWDPRQSGGGYILAGLAVALVAVSWTILRQRGLSRRIARQAAELAERESMLKAIYDHIPVAVTVIEALPVGYRILNLNRQAEAIAGVAEKDAVGRLLSELAFKPEWKQRLADLLQRWPAGSDLVREEHKLTAAHKLLVFSLIPLSPTANGNRRLCLLAEDVTQRRELDEEVSQSRKLRAVGELVGGIAHEFNNLLTPVMLQIGGIQADRAGDTRLHQALDVVERAMTRAAELTRRLLNFGRRAERRFESVQISTTAASCFELLRQTVDRRIVLEQAIPVDLPPLYFNSTDLHQVLLNLLLNARDTLLEKITTTHEDWRPLIRVEAIALSLDAVPSPPLRSMGQLVGWQRLTVRDNGLGMSPEVEAHIFEPFYTTKKEGCGSGLGLATVWHVVTEAGGRVEVNSVLGEGSAFHVYLPVWSQSERSRVNAPAQPAAAVAALRIMLAEDDELVARTILACLRRSGHAVTHLSDGVAAWKYLQEHVGDFDLLILDVDMPGINGIELSRRARTMLRYGGKIMIISGRLTSENMDALTDNNVDALLPKPFTPEQLTEAVRRARATNNGRSAREQ